MLQVNHIHKLTKASNQNAFAVNPEDNLDAIKRNLARTLNKLHSNFENLANQSLTSVANQMLSAGVINTEINRAPTFNAIVDSFISFVNCAQRKETIQEHCRKFLRALINVGPPIEGVAHTIREQWIDVNLKELNVKLNI